MKSILRSVAGGALLAACGWAGNVHGVVVATRNLRKHPVLVPAYTMRGAAPMPALAITANELERVVIFLEGPNLNAAQPVTARLEQKNQRFEPELLVVPVGSTVTFPNSDPVFHNVFSLSKARKFDLGYYPAGQTRILKFDQPGVVQVYCHLHPNMNAAIVVVGSRFYVRPGADGRFQIPDVPAGRYELVAWHRSNGFWRRSITVPENGTAEATLELPVNQEKGDR
jgi:plastocyanin